MNFFVSDGLIVSILLLNNLLGDIPNRPSSFKLLSSGNARIAFAVSHFAMLRDYQLWSTSYIAHAAEYKYQWNILCSIVSKWMEAKSYTMMHVLLLHLHVVS